MDRRFQVFALTHKKPTEAAEYILELEGAAQLVVDRALTHSYLEGPVEQAIDALDPALAKRVEGE